MVSPEELRSNLVKNAVVDQDFAFLPVSSRQEIDAALIIGSNPELMTDAVMSSMKDPTEFGFWVFNVLYQDQKLKPSRLFRLLAKVLVASGDHIAGKKYVQSVSSAFAEIRNRKLDPGAFADEFLIQALRQRKGRLIKLFLQPKPPSKDGSMLAMNSADEAQALILSAFQRHGGLKEFLTEHFSEKLIGRLVIEHGLSGLHDIISRKDRASLLSIELGM